MKTRTLSLVLTHHWFDEVKSGRKRIEYRNTTPFWMKRIWDAYLNRRFDSVRFFRGYTSISLTFKVEKIDCGECPIPGWDGKYIRIHFN